MCCLSKIKTTPDTSVCVECPQSHTSENGKKGLLSENKASQPTNPN